MSEANQQVIESLKYPIGRWVKPGIAQLESFKGWIEQIRQFPDSLQDLCRNLTATDLALTYREGSWTVRQVVHHCADSHMNAYIRHKLAFTEDKPRISPYDENLWSETKDVLEIDIEVSISLLKALHQRWVSFLQALPSKTCCDLSIILTKTDISVCSNQPVYMPGMVFIIWLTSSWH
ncbi:MAG: putative metal-dependent hydrolase [Saprospiraceae bacterium]|nr:putative metal-dependent hydrolase [Saprospiraceae bacterium]